MPPAAPSPQQLARWAIPEVPSLQLLMCNDDFEDNFVQCMAISPDGKQFVLGGTKLTVWDSTGAHPKLDLLEKYRGEEVKRPLLSVGISPNGNWLAAGDSGGRLRVWNLNDHSEVVSIRAHDARLMELAFSPDSRTLATTSYSGEVRLWHAEDGKQINKLKVDDQEVARLVFLSDGLLAAAGRHTSIWNVESGKQESVLTKERVIGPALGLSSDRQRLAFADTEAKIQLWDVGKAAPTGLALRRDRDARD